MTVSTTTNTVTYIGNGVTTIFSFPFIGVSSNDIIVTLTDTTSGLQTVLLSSQYTLALATPPIGGLWGIGGTVTYPVSGTPLATGNEITIARSVPYEQNISISNQGAFYPQSVEQALDLIEMQLQQTNTKVQYSIKAPTTDPSPPTNLPPAELRSGKVLGFDVTGLIPTMYNPSGITPVPPTQVQATFPTTAAMLIYYGIQSLTNGFTVMTGARSTVGDRGGAIFYYDASDTTSLDNNGTIRVDTNNRRWKARVNFVTPELFGAKGDGSTNDTTALQNTFNWGGLTFLGPYTYKYTTLTIQNPIRIEGAAESRTSNGTAGTLLLSSDAGTSDKIVIGNLSPELNGVVIEHICFSTPSSTGGAVLFYKNVSDCLLRDVQMVNLNSTATGIKLNQVNTVRLYDMRIINPVTYGIYAYGDDTHRSDEIDLVNVIISGDSLGAGTHVPDAITLDGFVNTVTGHHINVVNCGRGLFCTNTVGATSRGEYVFFHDFEVDFPKFEGVRLTYHDGVFIVNPYIHGSLQSNGVSVVHNGTQTTSNISFVGGQITSSSLYGMSLDGRNIRVLGMQIAGNGVLSGNNGINIGANSIGVVVTGNIIGPMVGFYTEHQSYGVSIENGAKEYNVCNNHLKGNLIGPVQDLAGLAGGDVIDTYDATVWNNTGQLTDQGMVISEPVSGDTITMNATQQLHIIGGAGLATLTVNFPSPASQGQKAVIWTQPAITTLTIGAGAGQTIDAGSVVTTLAAGAGVEYRFNQGTAKWYRFR